MLSLLHRLNPVLEAVITITEDLAYKQDKEADHLLAQGVDLGIALVKMTFKPLMLFMRI